MNNFHNKRVPLSILIFQKIFFLNYILSDYFLDESLENPQFFLIFVHKLSYEWFTI